MFQLFYVSVSTLSDADAHSEIEKIVNGSIIYNAAQGITGALIFARGHFAQALEGDEGRVDTLMEAIVRDARHRRVTVVERSQIAQPRFAPWSMAYDGSASYIGGPIESLLKATGREKLENIRRIYSLMDELTAS